MDLQMGDATDFCGGSRKRNKVIEVGNCTMWSELPAVLLESILKRIGVIEFLMFACVCKSWRSVAIAIKQEFMASQAPLVFLMSTHARKLCYFYNIFDQTLFKAELPHLSGNKCLGFTCGYLVLRDSEMTKKKPNIWLVNPFTGHELTFPSPPERYCNVILASLAKCDSKFVAVAFSRRFPFLQFCRSGDVNWTVFEYCDEPWAIIDVAVFKGKIYVLTSQGKIGTLNLTSDHMVTFLNVESVGANRDASRDNMHLVASNEELFIAHFDPAGFYIKIHNLDFVGMKLVKVKLMGEVLFLGDKKCCGLSFSSPSRSNFSKPLNQVLYLGERDGRIFGGYMARYVAGDLNERICATREDGKPGIFISSPIWYFPHLSCTVDSVYDD